MIQGYCLSEQDFCGECFVDWLCDLKGNNDLLVFSKFEVICEIYDVYFEVGVDIIEINIFNLMIIVMVDYQMEFLLVEINFVVVKLVCVSVDVWMVCMLEKLCYVVGVFGLINCIVFILFDVNDLVFCNIIFDQLVVVYCEFIWVLVEGGVDLILIEMVFDILNVKVVIYVVKEELEVLGVDLLLMIFGIIIDVFGCMFFGQIIEVFYNLLCYVEVLLFGLNCVFGLDELWQYVQELLCIVECYVIVYLNVGFFNVFGEYDLDVDIMVM